MHAMALLARTTLNATAYVAPGPTGRAVFHLFVRPLGRPRVKPAEEPLMGSARVDRIRVGRKEAVTYVWGDGERPVLLVHGWTSRASRLAAFAEALLARGYSPIAFDAPGSGEAAGRASNILDYRAIIRELHSRHGDFDAVVAHSFGALASLFALRDGVRTKRFVGIAGVGSFGLLTASFQAMTGFGERALATMRRHVERRLAPEEPGVWGHFDASWRPEDLGAPLLLIHDETDDMVPLAHAHALRDAHGDRARLVVTQGLGHRRVLIDPQVVAQVVEFVAGDTGEPGESGAPVGPGATQAPGVSGARDRAVPPAVTAEAGSR
ncbi:alpha/beta hydrolase [Streptomyces sp. NPDC093111]|uniref:alpha/beta hydrolase family protein n=1 Tax=Streptomyces sp. NPDC093111 TaxID=3154978 RepID=UPI00344A4333